MDDKRKFFTVNQLIEYLGKGTVTKNTIYTKIRNGEIPATCIGSRKLIPASWVMDFCNAAENKVR